MKFAPLSWHTPQHDLQKAVNSNQTTDDFSCSADLNRLLSAAVVNRRFCRRLLRSPQMAVAEGYDGYLFDLSPRESEAIYTIQATSLADFAQQLIVNLQQESATGVESVQPSKAIEGVTVPRSQLAVELL